MFTKKITDDDRFANLSSAAQALYLHLSMSADDDGFCNQVSASMFKAHASVSDLEALLQNRYIYQFESGIIVIKHWRMANALRKDRYTPTQFKEELNKLKIKDNGVYSLLDDNMVADWLPDGCRVVADCLPQVSIGKVSIDKDRLDKDKENNNSNELLQKKAKPPKHKYGEYQHVLLTDKERDNLFNKYGESETLEAIRFLDEYIEEKGYQSKSHNLSIQRWVFDAIRRNKTDNKTTGKCDVFDEWRNA